MTQLKELSARYMRLMGKCSNSATRLWTDEDVETGRHTTTTATSHSTIAYVTINIPILTSRTLINPTLINPTHISHTHISHTLPHPTPTKPAHSPLTDAVQPMFRLCQSALTNHGLTLLTVVSSSAVAVSTSAVGVSTSVVVFSTPVMAFLTSVLDCDYPWGQRDNARHSPYQNRVSNWL